MKKFFWCLLRVIRNHPSSKKYDELIYDIIYMIEQERAKVEIDCYFIVITFRDETVIKLWNENKFYGWLSYGYLGEKRFDYIMPSRSATYDFKKCLEEHGYNIYFPEPEIFPEYKIKI